MTEYELWNAVDDLTNEPCSIAAQHQARALARAWGVNGAIVVADKINRACVYYDSMSVALVAGGGCGCEDWHAFAKELACPWEGYG